MLIYTDWIVVNVTFEPMQLGSKDFIFYSPLFDLILINIMGFQIDLQLYRIEQYKLLQPDKLRHKEIFKEVCSIKTTSIF